MNMRDVVRVGLLAVVLSGLAGCQAESINVEKMEVRAKEMYNRKFKNEDMSSRVTKVDLLRTSDPNKLTGLVTFGSGDRMRITVEVDPTTGKALYIPVKE